jgi:hypothetical protein
VFGCEDATPALALVAAGAAVVVVVLVVDELLALDEVPAVDAVVAVDADWLELVPDAAIQPVSVNIAATLPAPTSRRERRAGCGLRFRTRGGVALR